ncbi:MAG: LysM peptidoglycan-binding domain-containing protein, partial [Anaerolineae bacterium]|nr:LysM peptidoglycan-binding domain-containing protein [Anaerolineae bacterium]
GRDAVVGRMNGNGVDLNRNWDYQHQITATHGTRPVKAGEYPFSEPETRFTRDFILERDIELVIFYHSAMGVIFSGAEPEKSATDELAEMLVGITGYTHNTEGIYGQITTGDSIDYLSAKEGIAGVEIELTTHALIGEAEWLRNLEGILAFLNWPIPGQAPPDLEDLDSGAWTYITYTVQTDDTLLGIVWNFKSDQDLIMALNGIENADQIWAGQVLTIPVRGGDE